MKYKIKNICYLTGIILLLSFTNCKKKSTQSTTSSTSSTSLHTGTLRDANAMGGCSWVIELDAVDEYGNKYLEPINLNNFNLNLVDGNKVSFIYIPKNDRYSPCMLGTLAELTMIFNQ